jgi:hypothetical protein
MFAAADRQQPSHLPCCTASRPGWLSQPGKSATLAQTGGEALGSGFSLMLTSSHSPSVCPDAGLVTPSASPPARLTTTAWFAQGSLAVGDWVRQGRWLGALGRASGWWIGDWVRYGNARYGERYKAAALVTGYDVHSLRNMAYVAGRFDVLRRRPCLSFSHHAELACLQPEEQELWLDRAEAGALSVRVLRSRLREARRRAASRTAHAQTRRERDEASSLISGATGVTSTSFRRAVRQDVVIPGVTSEVTCPQCGHHFAPAAWNMRDAATGTTSGTTTQRRSPGHR